MEVSGKMARNLPAAWKRSETLHFDKDHPPMIHCEHWTESWWENWTEKNFVRKQK